MSMNKQHEPGTCYGDEYSCYVESGNLREHQCDDCARREQREAFITRAEEVERKIRDIPGVTVRAHEAQTGTVYLTVDHEALSEQLKIRIADHGDCYGTSDYTADGLEGTDDGAIEFIKLCIEKAV
jgi:hypothetical protein